MILAPLRGVTIRCFRETFAEEIRAAGFTEAVTPFITAAPGYDPLEDRELKSAASLDQSNNSSNPNNQTILLTPQFIGKDPAALRACLERVKAAGYETADLNCGCPFPMVRNKGRGSGLMKSPEVLERMLAVGCEVMGPGRFSVKARLGVDRNDELLALMPMLNAFPLRYLTVHARTARQMYEGVCDLAAFAHVRAAARMPLVYNGDLELPLCSSAVACIGVSSVMLGRGFVRSLGTRDDARELLVRYLDASVAELSGDAPVLGRMKELLSYWKNLPGWRRRWPVVKICRTTAELRNLI